MLGSFDLALPLLVMLERDMRDDSPLSRTRGVTHKLEFDAAVFQAEYLPRSEATDSGDKHCQME